MKKITLSSIITGITVFPAMALAQMQGTAPGGYGTAPTDLPDLISKIENMVGLIFGCVAVICFVVAGILFLTAGGQPEKVQAARSAFIWGVAGVVVGLVAFSIIAIVASII